jgi:hypothetical protein
MMTERWWLHQPFAFVGTLPTVFNPLSTRLPVVEDPPVPLLLD